LLYGAEGYQVYLVAIIAIENRVIPLFSPYPERERRASEARRIR
jgi:hypothetical protein